MIPGFDILNDMIEEKKDKAQAERMTKLRDKLIKDAGEFDKLINIDAAWKIYVEKIQRRIDACRAYKARIKLATADNATKKTVELLEYQADILEWAITMPKDFMARVEKENARP